MQQTVISEGVEVVDRFEEALSGLGLTYERLALKKYPTGIHWHIRRPGSSGTLEATYLPEGHRLSLNVHANRTADWQQSAIEALVARL